MLLAGCNQGSQARQPASAESQVRAEPVATVPAYYPPGYAEMKIAGAQFPRTCSADTGRRSRRRRHRIDGCNIWSKMPRGTENASSPKRPTHRREREALARRVAKHAYSSAAPMTASLRRAPAEYERQPSRRLQTAPRWAHSTRRTKRDGFRLFFRLRSPATIAWYGLYRPPRRGFGPACRAD